MFNHARVVTLLLSVLICFTSLPTRAAWLDDYFVEHADHWINLNEQPSAQSLENRFYLLDFWTYCCINCIQAMPMVKKIHHDYGADISVIGIHSGKFSNERTELPIKRAIERYGINHAVFNDADYTIWKQFEVKGWPSLVLLNPDGDIVWRFFGEAPYEDVAKAVEMALSTYKGEAVNKVSLSVEAPLQKEHVSIFRYPSKVIALGHGRYALSDSGHDRVVILDHDFDVQESFEGFSSPQGLAVQGENLYVADTAHHQIKRINLRTKAIDVIAGIGKRGPRLDGRVKSASNVNLASPWDITFWNGQLIIANAGTHQLLALDTETQMIKAIAGNGREYIDDGYFPKNSLSQPSALSVLGDVLYFLDSETSSLRRMDKDGKITTLIGKGLFDFGAIDGTKDTARMQHPLGLGVDTANKRLFIADSYNQIIRLYDIESGYLQTISGKPTEMEDLSLDSAGLRYHEPNDVLVQSDNTLLIVDTNNHRLIQFNPYTDKVDIYR